MLESRGELRSQGFLSGASGVSRCDKRLSERTAARTHPTSDKLPSSGMAKNGGALKSDHIRTASGHYGRKAGAKHLGRQGLFTDQMGNDGKRKTRAGRIVLSWSVFCKTKHAPGRTS